ncbi:MAG: polyprenyl synthetase family protein, partial [Cyclobacteriaceae bacterium]
AVLLGFSLELGAILAEASETDRKALREFGTLAGIGFQLKDDLLDVYGDSDKVGKQVGGDIISNKKTYLLISALEGADPSREKELRHWLNLKKFDDEEKVNAIRDIYDAMDIRKKTLGLIQEYFEQALGKLKNVSAPMPRKVALRRFAERLVDRDH